MTHYFVSDCVFIGGPREMAQWVRALTAQAGGLEFESLHQCKKWAGPQLSVTPVLGGENRQGPRSILAVSGPIPKHLTFRSSVC